MSCRDVAASPVRKRCNERQWLSFSDARGFDRSRADGNESKKNVVQCAPLGNTMPAILNHASGSANPATSLSALWAYLQPALDHIVKSASNDPSGKAPAIDFGLYAGIHSACYN